MKKFFFIALTTLCAALLFSSCDKGVTNTGDFSADEVVQIYVRTPDGIWQLDSKTVDKETVRTTDFTSEHFYLCLNQIRMAFGKTGSLTGFDLDHVDVDFAWYAYNDQKHQISFDKTITLMQGLREVMRVSGTYDVLELSNDKLVISKTVGKSTTTYAFHKMFQQNTTK